MFIYNINYITHFVLVFQMDARNSRNDWSNEIKNRQQTETQKKIINNNRYILQFEFIHQIFVKSLLKFTKYINVSQIMLKYVIDTVQNMVEYTIYIFSVH